MIPYTLVLKPGLVIHSVYNGYWFWGRPSFEDLRRDLREVTREIRPDWDLAAPGLRAAWDAGDHSKHHPYQETDRDSQDGLRTPRIGAALARQPGCEQLADPYAVPKWYCRTRNTC